MPDSSDRWTRIRALLEAAWQLPPDEREALLRRECAGEPDLRAEVEALLRADENAPEFLDSDAISIFGPALPDKLSPEKKSIRERVIGSYRLLEEIGRGGMSRVYRAERAAPHFEQEVAIKLLRIGLDTEAGRRRFELERQVLATLDHPNIARLLDGGLTEDDVPYLVMEYVDGQPLDDYCDAHRCTVEERLDFVASVARALQYAHRNLVVHRDLKPSNILVTGDGTLKLLDFGIAKLLDAEAAGLTIPATRTGIRPMTPGFAAPEQIRGDAISVATDVYQLGVLTCELLTGQRPFVSPERSRFDLERAVLEEPPPRPSTVVKEGARPDASRPGERSSTDLMMARQTTTNELARTLRGDIDAIILKSLQKDPSERYGSTQAFAMDLMRYRKKLPVQARPITPLYRIRKFATRHTTGVLTATAITLLLVFLIILLVRQQAQTAEQRDLAETEAERAAQVSEFLVDLFEASNPMGEGDTVSAQELLERGTAQASQLSDRPETKAQMLEVMGRAHIGLANYDVADSLLHRAVELRRQSQPRADLNLAATMHHRAGALDGLGRYAAAESLAREALQIRQTLSDSPSLEVAESWNSVALALRRQGTYPAAESLYRRSLDVRQQLRESAHADISETQNNLGQLLTERGEYAAAESLHRQALASRKKLFGDEHPYTAESLNNLAQAVQRQGRLSEAEKLYRESLDLHRTLLGVEHPHVSVSMNNLAVVLEEQGHFVEAEELKRESLRIRRELLGNDHPQVTVSLNNLAVLMRKKEELEEAVALYEEVLERLNIEFDGEHPYIAITMDNLGRTYRAMGHLAAADSLLELAERMTVRVFGETHAQVANNIGSRADLHRDQGNFEKATTLHREALAMRRTIYGDVHPATAASLSSLAGIYEKQRDTANADSLYRQAVATAEQALTEDDWRLARFRQRLGAFLITQEQFAEAEPYLKYAYDAHYQRRGEAAPETQEAAMQLVMLYEAWDKPDQALAYQTPSQDNPVE